MKGKVELSCNRPWRPVELRDVEVPIFSRRSACGWRWGCQPYALAALYPTLPWRFLVVISVRGWVDPRAKVRPEGLGKSKNSSDFIGNQTHDPSAFSQCLVQTTLPRVLSVWKWFYFIFVILGDQFLKTMRYMICVTSLTSGYLDKCTDSFSKLVGTHETDSVSLTDREWWSTGRAYCLTLAGLYSTYVWYWWRLQSVSREICTQNLLGIEQTRVQCRPAML
jgi:hypothetical protein